jgi:hypothetical protein
MVVMIADGTETGITTVLGSGTTTIDGTIVGTFSYSMTTSDGSLGTTIT